MAITGVRITKIDGERSTDSQVGKVNVNNNVSIQNVKDKDLSFGENNKEGLAFEFLFECEYSSDLGYITLEGSVFFAEDEEKIEEILTKWKEDNEVENSVAEPILNAALNECNIQAVKTSQDLGLPSPVPMPKVKQGQ